MKPLFGSTLLRADWRAVSFHLLDVHEIELKTVRAVVLRSRSTTANELGGKMYRLIFSR